MPDPIDDVRSFDPIAYVQAIGLQPEDCYGFLPTEHEDVTPYLFLYRDRSEYERARAALPFAQPDRGLGPIPIDPAQQVEVDLERDLPGGADGSLGRKIAAAQRMPEAYGGGLSAAGAAPSAPEPEELVRLAKLVASGEIDHPEYMRRVAEATSPPDPVAAAPQDPAPAAPDGTGDDAGGIVAQRLYPEMGMRSSRRQVNHFLPRYGEMLGLRSEDVYGLLPRTTHYTSVDPDSIASDTKEWDDFWIVYRDRAEYERGRQAWAEEMSKDGKWPGAVRVAGVGEAPPIPHDGAALKIEKDRWPRRKLVVREQGSDLADSLREKIAKWGYEPEDSLGLCPDFDNGSIYFAWRGR